jgi:hypothetical protein
MLSYINRTRFPEGAKAALRNSGLKAEADAMGSAAGATSMPPPSDDGANNAGRDGQIIFVPPTPAKKTKKQAPQDAIDEFWKKFDSKTPGRGKSLSSALRQQRVTNLTLRIASTVLPKNTYAKKVGESVPKGVIRGENAVASYAEAVATCREKVAKIVKECKRVNQKYRDPHFDIEFDLKWGIYDCLNMLGDTSDVEPRFDPPPGSVKRVGDIFDEPEFYKGGATASDIRQGRDGDCWFMSALCTLGNKSDLIEKVCVARDEKVGVYGFVFSRDGEWISEVIDDKLYLIKPDYDESWSERVLIEDRQRINSEEDYRKIYQVSDGRIGREGGRRGGERGGYSLTDVEWFWCTVFCAVRGSQ